MDLRTTYLGLPLAHPLMPGASPLVDDLDTVKRLEDAGASADRHALAFRGADLPRARGDASRDGRPRGVLRGGDVLFPLGRGVRPRTRPVPRADPEDPRDRLRSRHRVPERRDGFRLAEICEAHAGCWRARARAEHLPHRRGPERPGDDDRARGREHPPERQARPRDPGRRQAPAVLHARSRTSRGSSTTLGRTASSCSTASTSRTSTSTCSSPSPRSSSPIPRTSSCACAGSRSSRAACADRSPRRAASTPRSTS